MVKVQEDYFLSMVVKDKLSTINDVVEFRRQFIMLNSFMLLALLCSTGSILVVLGTILTIPVVAQLIMLITGLILCGIGIFGVSKLLLSEKGR